MLKIKSFILLNAVVIALLSSSSLTTRAEDTATKPDVKTSEAPEVKSLHQKIGAGEVGAPHHKPRDSWIKNNEPTTSQETAKKVREAREAEMMKGIGTRDSNIKTSTSLTMEERLKESQKKIAERKQAGSQSGHIPKWKQNLAAKNAEAAKKAEAAKTAGTHTKEMPPLTSTYEEKVEHAPVQLKAPLEVKQGPEVVEHAPVQLKVPLEVKQGPEIVEHAPQLPKGTSSEPAQANSAQGAQLSDMAKQEQARLDKAMDTSSKKGTDPFQQRRMELEAKLKAKHAEAPAN
jgi:hypothetical protein